MARKRRVVTSQAAFARLESEIALLLDADETTGPTRFAAVCNTLDVLVRSGSMRLDDAALCLSAGLGIPHADLMHDLRERFTHRL